MCNTSKEMGSTRRDSAEVRSLLRGSLCASALLAGLTVADPALARSSYDGAWSVVVMTRGGACQGTWAAQRVGGAQAQVEGPGRPIYNYAPRYYGPRYTAPRYYPPAPLGGEY
jgi:hypothetical protein